MPLQRPLKGIWPILCGVILFRLLNAVLLRNAFSPDEHWQSSEVAHWLVFGYGFLTWEWEPCVALRSILHPGLIAAFYSILKYLHLDSRYLAAYGPRLVLGTATAAATDLGVYHLTSLWFGKTAGSFALCLSLCSWFFYYCLCRTYSSCIEAAVLVWGVYWWGRSRLVLEKTDDVQGTQVKIQNLTVSRRLSDLIPALCLASFGIGVRPTSAVFWGILFYGGATIDFILQPGTVTVLKSLRLFCHYVIYGSVLGILPVLNVLLDYAFYHRWTVAAANFATFNLLADPGIFYGTRSWAFYIVECPLVVLLTYVPLLLLGSFHLFAEVNEALFVPKHDPDGRSEVLDLSQKAADEFFANPENVGAPRKHSLHVPETSSTSSLPKESPPPVELMQDATKVSSDGLRQRRQETVQQSEPSAPATGNATNIESTSSKAFAPKLNRSCLPLDLVGLDPSMVLLAAIINLFLLSQASHKEYRLFLPYVPLLLPVVTLGAYRVLGELRPISTWTHNTLRPIVSSPRLLGCIILPQVLAAALVCGTYLRGSDSVMSALQKELQRIQHLKPPEVFFLTPCHDLPFYSFVHNPMVKLGFLDCSPQLRRLNKTRTQRQYPQQSSWGSPTLLTKRQRELQDRLEKEYKALAQDVFVPTAALPWRERFWKDEIATLDMLFPSSTNATAARCSDCVEPYVDPSNPNTLFTRNATVFGSYAPNRLDFQPITWGQILSNLTAKPSLASFAQCLDYRFDTQLQAKSLPDIFVVPSAAIRHDDRLIPWLQERGFVETVRVFNSLLSESPISGERPERFSFIALYRRHG